MNLQEFSRRKFGPEKTADPFSDPYPKSRPGPLEMSEIDPKSGTGNVKYGSFWVAVGPFGLGMGPYGAELVQKPIGPHWDPIWVTYGSVLVHFRAFGLLLDNCWLVPSVALLLMSVISSARD